MSDTQDKVDSSASGRLEELNSQTEAQASEKLDQAEIQASDTQVKVESYASRRLKELKSPTESPAPEKLNSQTESQASEKQDQTESQAPEKQDQTAFQKQDQTESPAPEKLDHTETQVSEKLDQTESLALFNEARAKIVGRRLSETMHRHAIARAIETAVQSRAKLVEPESPALGAQHEVKSQVSNEMAALKDKTVVFIIGGPGCGKGTQCNKIVEKFGYCHLSSGDLLRAEVASGSERGQQLNKIMETGQLVSLDVVLTLLKEAMLANSSASGFLIDGYPRDLEQGTRFENDICTPKHVVYFEVPDETMTERLLERAKTSGRVDDNEETIKKRLATYHEHTTKVIGYYSEKGLLRKIDATADPEAVFSLVSPVISG